MLTREILDRHGGRIDISSAPGQGTTAVVRFQAVERQSLRRATPTAPALSIAGLAATREILVVDDDARVRRSVARLLAREGYVVLEAEDGLAALALLGQRDTVGLVLSDVVMPRLGGVELAQRVQVEHGLPVLLMSGYFDAQGADPALPIVAKPFVPAELLAAVARVLGRPAPAPSEASAAAEAREAVRTGRRWWWRPCCTTSPTRWRWWCRAPSSCASSARATTSSGHIAEDIHEAALSCVAMTRQALRLASPRARRKSQCRSSSWRRASSAR
ncbi:MAG: hybrid sensor histidine kinase/response regulator [Myxococcota bacterium]